MGYVAAEPFWSSVSFHPFPLLSLAFGANGSPCIPLVFFTAIISYPLPIRIFCISIACTHSGLAFPNILGTGLKFPYHFYMFYLFKLFYHLRSSRLRKA
jgi:hypothetical protein